MWDLVAERLSAQPVAFVVGSVLIVLYQAARFNELNLLDPLLDRYRPMLVDMRARDTSSFFSYGTGLLSFLFVSLMIYYLACRVSPDIAFGVLKLFGSATAADVVKEEIPYPLYIAAIFIGLTQPVVPFISQIGDAQRRFFQRRIDVPLRVVEVTEHIIDKISADDQPRKRMEEAVITLLAPRWLEELEGFADYRFLDRKLKVLSLDPVPPEAALRARISGLSDKELTALFESLVLYTVAAAVRRTGSRGINKVVEEIRVQTRQPPVDLAYFVASGIALFVVTILIWQILDQLRTLVRTVWPVPLNPAYAWPTDSRYVGMELCVILPPAIIAAVVTISAWSNYYAGLATGATLPRRSVRYALSRLQAYPAVTLMCIVLGSVGIIVGNMYVFGQDSRRYDFSSSFYLTTLLLILIQSLISLPLSAAILLKLEQIKSGNLTIPNWWCTLVLSIAVPALSVLYMVAWLALRSAVAEGRELIMFSVISNTLVALSVFFCFSVFLKSPRRATMAGGPVAPQPIGAR